MRIGLLSDTHGYLDQALLDHFSECDELWHAGDLGAHEVWRALQAFRPLVAVHGNIDDADIRRICPENVQIQRQGLRIWMTHIGATPPYTSPIRQSMRDYRPDIFVCGHSHILRIERDQNTCLYLNPGAAGHIGHHQERTALRFCLQDGKVKQMEVISLGKRGISDR